NVELAPRGVRLPSRRDLLRGLLPQGTPRDLVGEDLAAGGPVERHHDQVEDGLQRRLVLLGLLDRALVIPGEDLRRLLAAVDPARRLAEQNYRRHAGYGSERILFDVREVAKAGGRTREDRVLLTGREDHISHHTGRDPHRMEASDDRIGVPALGRGSNVLALEHALRLDPGVLGRVPIDLGPIAELVPYEIELGASPSVERRRVLDAIGHVDAIEPDHTRRVDA